VVAGLLIVVDLYNRNFVDSHLAGKKSKIPMLICRAYFLIIMTVQIKCRTLHDTLVVAACADQMN
jgi:hypothetical protein